MSDASNITHERMRLLGEPSKRANAADFLAAFEAGQVPSAPGCYIMLDAKGKPIYVGKAKDLRARIRTYINESDGRYSVKFLMRRVADIDFLVTANEKEALLLENSLIKQYRPRYNVRLKDDKTYVCLRINLKEDFPRITVTRKIRRDGARYFGPYHSAVSVRQTVRYLQRIFPLRTCTDHVLKNRTRPCIYHQMKQCAAPCVDYIDRAGYHEIVAEAVMVLEGRSDELERHIRERIARHAEALEFEQAAELRDRLQMLQETMERQRTVDVVKTGDRDVWGLHNDGAFTEIQVLFYRGGKMLGGRCFSFEHREMPVDELLSSFLLQYYSSGALIPPEILVPLALEEADTLAEVLGEERERKVQVHWPQRGDKRALLDLARRNAERSFAEKRLQEKAQEDTLEQLREALHLATRPERIECFDISTIQGAKSVASMVVFTNAQPDKARYRRFSIKSVAGQDDFACMREVLLRRFTRAIEEDDLPDLVLIDGGKGQLNVASAVFKDLGIEDLPRTGIAKARTEDGGRSPERLFVPGRMNPIILNQSGPVVRLLTHIRDEAHRFAITYHRKKRGKAALSTTLTDVPGIGPARARTLLNKLGSVARIRAATVADIAALPGFDESLARRVRAHLDAKPGGTPEAALPDDDTDRSSPVSQGESR